MGQAQLGHVLGALGNFKKYVPIRRGSINPKPSLDNYFWDSGLGPCTKKPQESWHQKGEGHVPANGHSATKWVVHFDLLNDAEAASEQKNPNLSRQLTL